METLLFLRLIEYFSGSFAARSGSLKNLIMIKSGGIIRSQQVFEFADRHGSAGFCRSVGGKAHSLRFRRVIEVGIRF